MLTNTTALGLRVARRVAASATAAAYCLLPAAFLSLDSVPVPLCRAAFDVDALTRCFALLCLTIVLPVCLRFACLFCCSSHTYLFALYKLVVFKCTTFNMHDGDAPASCVCEHLSPSCSSSSCLIWTRSCSSRSAYSCVACVHSCSLCTLRSFVSARCAQARQVLINLTNRDLASSHLCSRLLRACDSPHRECARACFSSRLLLRVHCVQRSHFAHVLLPVRNNSEY